MRIKSTLGTIGWILLMFSVSFIAPMATGFAFKEPAFDVIGSYGLPMLLTILLGVLFWAIGKDEVESVREREAFAAVGFGWLLIAFLGSLPYLFSGTLDSPVDAYFESMSGFATCGATTIRPPAAPLDYLDVYTHSIFLWRALTQWIGGLGIIVMSVVILAKILGGGLSLFKAEVAGHTVTRLKPKLQQTAKLLWGIYILYTGVEAALLYIAGMNLYDAVCHSFTTLATGGFGTHTASIAYWDSPWIELIVAAFVLVGSISFVLHYNILTGHFRAMLRDQELRFYVFLVTAGTILITLNVRGVYGSVGEAVRYSSFQTISIIGTAGFTTWSFSGDPATAWPFASQFMLVVFMLIGGCVGSTAGAIKISRVLILLKVVRREIHKVLHPRAVIPIKMGGQIISEGMVGKIGVFFFAYMVTFFFCIMFLMFLDPALDVAAASSAVATTMGGVGPGLGSVHGHCADVTAAGKVLLSLCMWIGRLEIFSALILFFPSTYKS